MVSRLRGLLEPAVLDDLSDSGRLEFLASVVDALPGGAFKASRLEVLFLEAEARLVNSQGFEDLWLEALDVIARAMPEADFRWLEPRLNDYISLHLSDVSVVGYSNLVGCGWTARDIVQESLRLSVGNIESWTPQVDRLDYWVGLRKKSFPFMGALLVCGRFVGNWAMSLLTDDDRNGLFAGSLGENEFSGAQFLGAGSYKGYVSTIVVDRKFRAFRLLAKLLADLCSNLGRQRREGVFFDSICAEAWSREGASLCRTLGLDQVGKAASGYPLFEATGQQVLDGRVCRRYGVCRPRG